MKDEILQLKAQGKKQSEIAKILGCSRSIVSYHCTDGQKEKYQERQRKRRSGNGLLRKLERVKTTSRNWNNKSTLTGKRSIRNKRRFIPHATWTEADLLAKVGQNPKCYLTGRPINLSDSKSYELDHVIPLAKGGTHDIGNVNLAIKNANRAKSDMLVPEFLDLCKEILVYNGYIVVDP